MCNSFSRLLRLFHRYLRHLGKQFRFLVRNGWKLWPLRLWIEHLAQLPINSSNPKASTMASNTTQAFPPLSSPSCHLVPQEPLLSYLSDNILAIVLPTIVYAIAGAFFHLLDTYNLFSSYRIHPSEDELKRNHVTKWQCLQAVVRYHIMQISIALLLNQWGGNEPTMVGDESCRILSTAGKIIYARNFVPMMLAILGIDAKRLGTAMRGTSVGLAQVLSGDYLSSNMQNHGFTALELSLAKFIVNFGVPAFQYFIALTVVDTWIYFTHRLCHVNRTLYRNPHPLSPISAELSLISCSYRYRPRPTPPHLRLLRLRRRLRTLARDPLPRHLQLRISGRDSPAFGTAKYAVWFVCDYKDY